MSQKPFDEIECLSGITLRDPATNQPMHSRIGPQIEAELIYILPSQLERSLTKNTEKPLVLWDVGMGIAANSSLAWSLAKSLLNSRPLKIHSFEIQLQAIRQALETPHRFPFLESIQEDLHELLKNKSCRSGHHSWTLHEGNFKEQVHASDGSSRFEIPDLIFWDFYTPKACPDLWSFELFQQVRELSPQAELYTYSAATPIRVGLLLAGFWVGVPRRDGSATPMKRESTVATTFQPDGSLEDQLLGQEWLEKFERSSQFRPYGNSQWTKTASFFEIQARLRAHRQFDSPHRRFVLST